MIKQNDSDYIFKLTGYVQVLSKFCAGFVQVLSRLCPSFVQVLSRFCPSFVQVLPGFVQVISKFCPGYIQVLSRFCPSVVRIFHDKSNTKYSYGNKQESARKSIHCPRSLSILNCFVPTAMIYSFN